MKKAKKRTPNAVTLTNLIVQVFPVHGLLGTAGDELTAPWKLTSARWKVLGTIDLSDRPLHVAQIARNMGLTRQAVQRVVNDLVEQDLLELHDNPDHQRAVLVCLTPRGRKTLDEIDHEQIRWSNDLAEGIKNKDLEIALQVITTLRSRLEQKTKERKN